MYIFKFILFYLFAFILILYYYKKKKEENLIKKIINVFIKSK